MLLSQNAQLCYIRVAHMVQRPLRLTRVIRVYNSEDGLEIGVVSVHGFQEPCMSELWRERERDLKY